MTVPRPNQKLELVRQTNVNLVAAKLAQVAARNDLVVVYPWYNGISFARYCRGSASRVTFVKRRQNPGS